MQRLKGQGSYSQRMSLSEFLQNKLLPKRHCTWIVRDYGYPNPTRNSNSPGDLNQQGAPSYPFEQGRRPNLRWSLFWLHRPFGLSVQYFACIKLLHVFFKRFNVLAVTHYNKDVSLLNLII